MSRSQKIYDTVGSVTNYQFMNTVGQCGTVHVAHGVSSRAAHWRMAIAGHRASFSKSDWSNSQSARHGRNCVIVCYSVTYPVYYAQIHCLCFLVNRAQSHNTNLLRRLPSSTKSMAMVFSLHRCSKIHCSCCTRLMHCWHRSDSPVHQNQLAHVAFHSGFV